MPCQAIYGDRVLLPDNSYRISYYTRSIGFNINLPKYNGGELWHSYLNRVAIANNLPSADVLLGELSPLGDANWNKTQRLDYDCMKEASHSITIENHDDWILSGTTFQGRTPLMSRIMAARRIYRYCMPSSMHSKIIGTQPEFIQELRVCPECFSSHETGLYCLGDIHTQMHVPNPHPSMGHLKQGSVYRLNSHTLSTESIDG